MGTAARLVRAIIKTRFFRYLQAESGAVKALSDSCCSLSMLSSLLEASC